MPYTKTNFIEVRESEKVPVNLLIGEEAVINSPYVDTIWSISIPQALDYDNTECSGSQCVQEIKYKEVALSNLRGKDSIHIQDIPQLNTLGTHRIVMKSGNKRSQLQLIIRRDNTYVGYLTELLGVPFVYAPALTAEGHQTDLRLGADCVSLLIYGKRRQGNHIPYVAPPKLYDYTVKLGDSKHLAETAIEAGDILHFGFQTAVISVDNPPQNVLSENDLIIHTYHKLAEEVPFSELPYKSSDFDILRWDL